MLAVIVKMVGDRRRKIQRCHIEAISHRIIVAIVGKDKILTQWLEGSKLTKIEAQCWILAMLENGAAGTNPGELQSEEASSNRPHRTMG